MRSLTLICATLAAFAAGQSALARPPLPMGPGDRQVYIKINHQEYPVPYGMTPDAYYSQMVGGGRIQQSVQTRQFPQDFNPRAVLTFSQPRPIATRPIATQPIATPMASYHVGFAPAAVATPAPVYTARRPIPAATNYPPVSPLWPTNFNFGQRQWVKLAEGTQPIEVPYGADPQQFLAGLRFSQRRGLSALEGEKKKYKKIKYVAQEIIKKAPPPPPLHVKKTPIPQTKFHHTFKAPIIPPQFTKKSLNV